VLPLRNLDSLLVVAFRKVVSLKTSNPCEDHGGELPHQWFTTEVTNALNNKALKAHIANQVAWSFASNPKLVSGTFLVALAKNQKNMIPMKRVELTIVNFGKFLRNNIPLMPFRLNTSWRVPSEEKKTKIKYSSVN